MGDPLRLAIGTFTTWVVAPPRRIDIVVAGRAMLLAPLTLLPFVMMAGVAWFALARPASRLVEPPLMSVLLLAALVLSTRAMHLDGLADTCDGLSASYDRERALEVMRRSDVGPSGVAGIVLVLLAQGAALSSLLSTAQGALVAAVAVLASRHAVAWMCLHGVPAARPGGLGATVAGSVSPFAAVAALAALGVCGTAAGAWVAVPLWRAPVVVLAALAGAAFVVRRSHRRLGGISGDVIGAGIEIALTFSLVAAAIGP